MIDVDDLPEDLDGLVAPPLSFVPNAGQRIALDRIERLLTTGSARAEGLTGPAGTGKTTVLQAIKPLVTARPHSIGAIWTAMTGKAATRMRDAAGVPATTLHAVLYEPPESSKGRELKFGTIRDPEGDVLVIDEASMVTPQIAADIGVWIKHGVRVLYVGDGFQLPPILSKEEEKKYGKGDYSIFGAVPTVGLTQVMRNGDDILDAATMLRTKHNLPTGVSPNGSYELLRVSSPSATAIERYLEDPEDHALITWVNTTRMAANLEIRRRLGISDPQPQPGEPILVCRNGRDVLNGEIYEIAEMTPGIRLASVPTWMIRTKCHKFIFAAGHDWSGNAPYFPDYDEWKAYRREINEARVSEPIPITYGHVLTAHKAQGSEYRRVTVFLPRRDHTLSHFRANTTLPDGSRATFGTRWLYTALSRARSRVSILMEG